MAALLLRRQFQRLRNIWKNSSKAWSDLGQFGRNCPHLPAEIVPARGLRQTTFKDLGEGEKWKWFVSFVTVPDQVSEASARCVLRHLHRQPGLAHAWSAGHHDD